MVVCVLPLEAFFVASLFREVTQRLRFGDASLLKRVSRCQDKAPRKRDGVCLVGKKALLCDGAP